MLPFVYQENQVRVVKIDEEPWFVAKDVCMVFGDANYRRSVSRLDDDEKGVTRMNTLGGVQNMSIVNEFGLYSLLFSMQPKKANVSDEKQRERIKLLKDFKRWVFHEVLPSILKTGSYTSDTNAQLLSLQKSFDELTEKINKTGFLNPLVNYRHQFEQLNVYYRDATGDDSHRGIHEACGDYFGFPVPYSKDIATTLRDYVLCRIADDMDTAVDKLRMFIAGIKSKTIVLSSFGRWVNLNGFSSNDVEWGKVLKEFDHKCAYCGKKTALMPEHIVPQSEMAKVSPHEVSLISSIVPSCGACNHSKNKNDMETWFRNQPFFTENKLKKIVRHHNKYKLN